MCYSAEADLIAGAVIGGAGVDAVRHVTRRREFGLAALPLLFGTHQVIEALTWWGLEGKIPAAVGETAMWVYLVIAFLLPALAPWAVWSIETDPVRRRRMAPFIWLGAVVAIAGLAQMATGPVWAEVGGRYIAYHLGLDYGGQIGALYVAATCLPPLLSGRRAVVVFGAVNLAAVLLLAWLNGAGLISLWCAWAAVTSIVIVIHLRAAPAPEIAEEAMTRSQ
jgi:hypothetical protein